MICKVCIEPVRELSVRCFLHRISGVWYLSVDFKTRPTVLCPQHFLRAQADERSVAICILPPETWLGLGNHRGSWRILPSFHTQVGLWMGPVDAVYQEHRGAGRSKDLYKEGS